MSLTQRTCLLFAFVGIGVPPLACGGGFNPAGRDDCTPASGCPSAGEQCCAGFCVEPSNPLCGSPDDTSGGDTTADVSPDTTPCTPQCTDRECGDNGCGGLCGDCTEANTHCDQGTCLSGAPEVCVWGENSWGDGCLWGP